MKLIRFFFIFKALLVCGNTITVNDEDSFRDALDSNTTIVFSSNINLNSTIVIADIFGLVIDGHNYILSGQNRIRCLDISGQNTTVVFIDINIVNGTVSNYQNGGGIRISYSTVQIIRSNIDSCYSDGYGGGIYVKNEAILELMDSTLSRNIGNLGGGLHTDNSIVSIFNSSLVNNIGFNYGGAFAAFFGGNMTVLNSVISNNHAPQGGAGNMLDYSNFRSLTVSIKNTRITNNHASINGGCFYLQNTIVHLVDNVFAENSATLNGGCLMVISSVVYLESRDPDDERGGGHRLAMANNSAGLDGGVISIADEDASLVLVGDIQFMNNVAGRNGGAIFSYEANIIDQSDSVILFRKNSAGQSSTGGSGGAIYWSLAPRSEVNISRASFEQNTCTFLGGAVRLEVGAGVPKPSMVACEVCGYDEDDNIECLFIADNSTWREWNHSAAITLHGIDFMNNSALGSGGSGGALSITNGLVELNGCLFKHNVASTLGGALYLPKTQYPEATAEVTVSETKFESNYVMGGKGNSLYSESASTLTFTAETMFEVITTHEFPDRSSSSDVEFDGAGNVIWGLHSGIKCETGYEMTSPISLLPFPAAPLPGWNNTECLSAAGPCSSYFESCWPPMLSQSLAYNCSPCASGTYSLQRGLMLGGVVDDITCLETPYGGDCTDGGDDLLARPGFYGSVSNSMHQVRHNNDDDEGIVDDDNSDNIKLEVAFVACPSGFCCEDENKLCAWDQTCAGHRTDTLCGKCKSDYSISMLGSNCVNNDHCVWVSSLFSLELLKVTAYCLLFYSRPNIGFTSPFALVAFYDQFYNVLMVESTSDSEQAIAMFGFIFGGSSSLPFQQQSNICAWPGMQPLTRSFAPFVDVLAMLSILFAVWVVGKVNRLPRHSFFIPPPSASSYHNITEQSAERSSVVSSLSSSSAHDRASQSLSASSPSSLFRNSIDTFDQPTSHSQHLKRLAAAAAQALNFSVGTVATASTQLLTCTSDLPGQASRLLIAAEVECYTTWQFALMVLMFVLVFIVSLPLVFALVYSCGATGAIRKANAMSGHIMRDRILGSVARLATNPFKEKYWYWLSVMIFQRILLAVIHVIINLTATTRALWAVCVCVLFLVFHSLCHPFKLESYNNAQTFLLSCTVLVAAMNIVPSDMITNALNTSSEMTSEMNSLSQIKALLLIMPITLVLSWWVHTNRKDVFSFMTTLKNLCHGALRQTWATINHAYRPITSCFTSHDDDGTHPNHVSFRGTPTFDHPHSSSYSFDENESTLIGDAFSVNESYSRRRSSVFSAQDSVTSSVASSPEQSSQLYNDAPTPTFTQNYEYF